MAEEAEANNIINFYWVRHAESVANLYNNKPTDNYPKNSSNLDKLKIEVQRFLNNDYNNVQKMRVDSSSTLIGGVKIVKGAYPLVDDVYEYIEKFVQQEKSEKITELENHCTSKRTGTFESYIQDELNKIYDFDGDPNNGQCIKTVQGLVKEKYANNKPVTSGFIPDYADKTPEEKNKIAQLYAHWLQNFIPTNFLFQPTLSHMGVTQASILGEQFAENTRLNDINPDIIICSAMVRTMMTAYLTVLFANATREEGKKLPATIYIVPYINEKQHDAKFVFPPNEDNKNFYDFADVAIHPDKIQEVAIVIQKWFETNYEHLFADIYKKNEENNNGYNPKIPNVNPEIPNVNPEIPNVIPDITFNTDMYITEGGTDEESKEIVRQVDIKKFKTFFKDKNKEEGSLFNKIKNILIICHGFVIDEIHGETGINLIKNIIKDLNSQEVFNTWGCNTSVFNHPYFISDNHDPFENACLVKSVEEFDKFNDELKEKKEKEEKEKFKYTQLIKNLGLDETLFQEIYAFKTFIKDKKLEEEQIKKEKNKDKLKIAIEKLKNDRIQELNEIDLIIDKLKEKYLLYYLQGDKLVRNNAITNLRAEDKTKFGENEKLTSLRPGSLRGDIALITHGKRKKKLTIGGKRIKLPYKKKTKRLDKKYTKKHRMNKFKKYTRNKNKKKWFTRR